MSGWGVLAVTGAGLLAVAFVLAITAFAATGEKDAQRYFRLSQVAFGCGCGCAVGAVWWAAA